MTNSNVNISSKIVNLYGIFDTVVGDFIHYFPASDNKEAMNIVRGVMNDQNSYLYKNRESYVIYLIASSDGFERLKVALVDDLAPNTTYQFSDDPNFKEFLRTINVSVQAALTSCDNFKNDIREQFKETQYLTEKLIKLLETKSQSKNGILSTFSKK